MTPTRLEILRDLRQGAEHAPTLAKRVRVSHRTLLREVAAMVDAGLVEVCRGGGRGRETRVAISDAGLRFLQLSEIPGRVYEDPADRFPGAEYTRPLDEAEARRDRAERYLARFGKLPSWASS